MTSSKFKVGWYCRTCFQASEAVGEDCAHCGSLVCEECAPSCRGCNSDWVCGDCPCPVTGYPIVSP